MREVDHDSGSEYDEIEQEAIQTEQMERDDVKESSDEEMVERGGPRKVK